MRYFEVKEMYTYSHGGNAIFESGKEGIIDLSANINPLGMPKGVQEAIVRGIANCERYPDSESRELRNTIAAFETVNPDWIFCGNGASDIIFRLPRALQAKKVLTMAPSFLDYERAALSCGAALLRHALSADKGFTLDETCINAVQKEKPELVFLCNPNNPTGRLTEIKLIEELLSCCLNMRSRVLVDECFLDFSEQADSFTSKRMLARYPNLIVLKAFTKLFALPGIRLGYAICSDRDLIQSLYFHGADWPVSNLAQAAGIAALVDAERFINKTVEYVATERRLIKKELDLLGYKVFESKANYVFLQNPYSFDLRDELDKKGLRIRSCGNFPGLDGSYYRIAVSTKENNTKIVTAISEVTK